jgi:hypothetical protein
MNSPGRLPIRQIPKNRYGRTRPTWWVWIVLAVGVWIWLSESRLEKARTNLPWRPSATVPNPMAGPTGSSRPASAPDAEADFDGVVPETVVEDYGFLARESASEYRSPAGLRYTRGSAEGHRLAHLYRHTVDAPTRPGPHGVFDGGMPGALRTVDEAFRRARQKGRGVQHEIDEGRDLYTVELSKRVGFMGGQLGQTRRHPPATKVRLIVDGDRLITAFPL